MKTLNNTFEKRDVIMDDITYTPEQRVPRYVVGVVLSALMCAGIWFLPELAIFLPAWIALLPIIAAFCIEYCGAVALGCGLVAAGVAGYLRYGIIVGMAMTLSLLLVAVGERLVLKRKVDFVKSIWLNTGIALLAAILSAETIVAVYGPLDELLPQYIRKLWDSSVTTTLFSRGLSAATSQRLNLLNLLAARSYLTQTLIDELNAGPTTEVYTRTIEYVTYTMKYAVQSTYIGEIVAGALKCGLVATAWPRMVIVRRDGLDKDEGENAWFMHLRDWHLPHDLTWVLCGAWLATAVLVNFLPPWWYNVDYSIKQCAGLLFCVQGLAALERRLKADGVMRGRRGLLLTVGAILVQRGVILIGVASALFGSQGTIRALMDKLDDFDDFDDF